MVLINPETDLHRIYEEVVDREVNVIDNRFMHYNQIYICNSESDAFQLATSLANNVSKKVIIYESVSLTQNLNKPKIILKKWNSKGELLPEGLEAKKDKFSKNYNTQMEQINDLIQPAQQNNLGAFAAQWAQAVPEHDENL